MASQQTAELCKAIIKDIYGDLAAQVVGCLLNIGRLTSSQISERTSIPFPVIKRTLVSLIQNRFVLYWIHPDSPKTCHYYANPKEILHLLSIPNVLETIASRFPGPESKALEIIKNIFAFGHIKVSDYIDGASSQILPNDPENINNADYEFRLKKLRNEVSKVMTELVSNRLLSPLFSFDFHSKDEIYSEIYKNQFRQLPRTQSETVRKNTATDAADREFNELIGQRDASNAGLVSEDALREKLAAANGKNAASTGASLAIQSTRRVRRNVALSEPKFVVNPDTVLSVNYDKFLVIFRNDELASIASRTVGNVSALVYRHLLRCYESKLFRCSQKTNPTSSSSTGTNDPPTTISITTMAVINSMDSTIDLKSSIVLNPISSNTHNGGTLEKKRSADYLSYDDNSDLYENQGANENDLNLDERATKRVKTTGPFSLTDENLDDDESQLFRSTKDSSNENEIYNNFTNSMTNGHGGVIGTNGHGNGNGNGNGTNKHISAQDVNRHLDLIAASPLKLLTKAGNRGGGEWIVPFDDLRGVMKRIRYDEIIENKFGPQAIRVLRIIREKGMANDELLARAALLKAETISKISSELHNFGALDLQEIPRSQDRAPSKTIFLWFHCPTRAYRLLIERIEKAITRLLQRIQAERENHPILLAKLSREDVKLNENLYLTPQEKLEISQLRSIEEKAMVQVGRLQALTRIYSEY